MNLSKFLCNIFIVFTLCNSAHIFYGSIKQESIKKNMIFSNGKSLFDLELELKEEFTYCPNFLIVENNNFKIPGVKNPLIKPTFFDASDEIKISRQNTSNNQVVSEKYKGPLILIPLIITNLNYDGAKFLILHEIGHVNSSANATFITFVACVAGCFMAYKCPDTKFSNRYISFLFTICDSLGFAFIVYDILSNVENRRADNFAIKHSSIEELKGGLKVLQNFKGQLQEEWDLSFFSSIFSFQTSQYITDFDHPHIDSRIQKIKTAFAQAMMKEYIEQNQESNVE